MTLKEKINDALFYIEPKTSLIKCELLAIEFAVDFAKWLECLRLNKYAVYAYNSEEELLEMYKKEKGL